MLCNFAHTILIQLVLLAPTIQSFNQLSRRLPLLGKNRLLMSTSTFKFTSYNVLSSSLCEPNYFTSCKAEFLDPPYRLKKLKEQLDEEISTKSIICLQEVSHLWAGSLHTYFAKRGYYFATCHYGNQWNDYMGVGIAVPLDKYEIDDVNIKRISDTKKLPRKPKLTLIESYINKLKNLILSIAQSLNLYKPKEDYWWEIVKRYNQMVSTKLTCKESKKSFVIGTYHMPCAFRTPQVMIAHCALSAQYLQKYAGDAPCVFVGDFNVIPGSTGYRTITEGSIEKTHPDYPEMKEGDSWLPEVKPAFKSAYVSANGKEPDFTNYAKIKDDPTFIETLDYIFHCNKWTVQKVKNLKHRDEVVGPLPNEDEPSDHVLISAEMSLD